jgi:hypothetical protein
MSARHTFREMSTAAVIAYLVVGVLALTARVLELVLAGVAELAGRIADAGDVARAAVRGPVVVTVRRPSTAASAA